MIMHPIGAVKRTSLYNMVLILLSVIFAAIVVAISISRYSFGSSIRSGVATANERTKQSGVAGATKQFLVVVLPDGRVVNPRPSDLL